MVSGIGVFYPDKRPTQRVGIVPDQEVKPTIAGVRAGRDEVLEAALRKILGSDVYAAEIEKLAKAYSAELGYEKSRQGRPAPSQDWLSHLCARGAGSPACKPASSPAFFSEQRRFLHYCGIARNP
jgi:hypothetical protein